MINITGMIALVSLGIAATTLTIAQAGKSVTIDETALSAWEHMVSLEPCMNGEVSSTGLYPSQIAEDKSFATMGMLAGLAQE